MNALLHCILLLAPIYDVLRCKQDTRLLVDALAA